MSEQQEPQLPYVDRLKQVRVMPQTTEEEKLAKHEAARDLRIETTLSWASFAKETVDTLMMNPNIPFRELKNILLKHKDTLSRPQLAERFIGILERARSEKNEALSFFRRQAGFRVLQDVGNPNEWSDYGEEEVGERIFRSITKQRPVGSIGLLFTPLAVIIKPTSKDDFDKLDNRQNVGGFYNHQHTVKQERKILFMRTEYTKQTFPLIVVSNNDPRILKHEIGHSINRAVIDTLAHFEQSYDTRGVWGSSFGIPKISEKPNTPEKLEGVLRDKVIPYALARAKDELITDFVASGNFNYLSNLIKEDGLYDYFNMVIKSWYGIKKVDELEGWMSMAKSKVWKEYVVFLNEAVHSAQQLADDYASNRMFDRYRLLPYVLAQKPMQTWESQKRNGTHLEWTQDQLQEFKDEVLAYRHVYEDATNLSHSYNKTLGKSSDRMPLLELFEILENESMQSESLGTNSAYKNVRNIRRALELFTKRTGYTLKEANFGLRKK